MEIVQTPVRIFSTGGVERYVRDLSGSLAERGHHITIICANTPGPGKVGSGIEVRALSPVCRVANTEITPGLPAALVKGDWDIFHTHMPTPWCADWTAFAAWIKKKPLILSYFNDITGRGYAAPLAWMYNRAFLRRLLDRSDRIVVLRQAFPFAALGPYAEKVRVIPPGVDMQVFSPKRTERLADIFFLSVLDRFHHYKGLDILLEAVEKVRTEFPAIRLVIGGSGSGAAGCRTRVHAMGLDRNVSFAGFIPDADLPRWYAGSRMFVLASTDPALEGFGIVLLEALGCGTPVVTTDIPGVAPEIRESGAGLVVSPGSADELARAITALMRDEERGREMGRRGRRLVEENYSWQHAARKMEGLYREVA